MKWHYTIMRERKGPILKRYAMFVSWEKLVVSSKMVVAELYLFLQLVALVSALMFLLTSLCSKNSLLLLNHAKFSLNSKWHPAWSKAKNVHEFYHVTIWILRDVVHYLQRVCSGSFSCNWSAFTTSFLFSCLEHAKVRKLAKLEEEVGESRVGEEEPEGEVVVGPSREAVVYSSGNTPLFFANKSFHQLYYTPPLLCEFPSGIMLHINGFCVTLKEAAMGVSPHCIGDVVWGIPLFSFFSLSLHFHSPCI